MRIVISGAGDVGFHLAKLLAYEEHEIVLIDTDQKKLDHAASNLDVAIIKGSSVSLRTLVDANVKKADLVIAVTQNEEANISTAILAKHLGAKKTVARVQSPELIYSKDILDHKDLGIDEVISPESLAAREIKRLIRESGFTDSFDFDNGKLALVGTTIREGSLLQDKSLQEMGAELNGDGRAFNNVAILRDTETIIPTGLDFFRVNDHAYFITLPEGTDKILDITGQEKKDLKTVMILGGSRIGFHTAKTLGKKYKVKLIEQVRGRCEELVDQLKQVMVINGDGRDLDLLKQNGIAEIDVFIAVTGNSETNIISCLVAKKLGVKKTICLVENMDYIHLSQDMGVDTMINKKVIAASFIFRYIRKGDVISLTSMHGVDAEVLEFIVKSKSKIIKGDLRELKFPAKAVIGGVIRKGKGIIPAGDFRFEPDDRAVILCDPNCIHTVEEFFK